MGTVERIFPGYLYLVPDFLRLIVRASVPDGATDDYVRFRRGEVAPVYNYGCYEATKNTFGIMVYQERLMSGGTILAGEQRSISAISEGISLSSAHCNATV